MSAQQPEPVTEAAPEANAPATGTSALRARRERASRKPPPPRHPKPAAGTEPVPASSEATDGPARAPQPRSASTQVAAAEPVPAPQPPPVVTAVDDETPAQTQKEDRGQTAAEISHEITRAVPEAEAEADPEPRPNPGAAPTSAAPAAAAADADLTEPVTAAPSAASAASTAAPAASAAAESAPETAPRSGRGETGGAGAVEAGVDERQLPDLEVDLDDPTALLITPTVLSVPNSILRRFEQARVTAPSHTALVLDALRAHAAQLPDLVKALRPGPRPGDLFPYRATPGAGSGDRPGPLRIRPTAGELGIMDRLTGWVNDEIRRGRAGVRKVSRSEVVAVALDSYLPPLKRSR